MKLKQHVILPDIHAPWHNKPLLKKVCQLITDIRPHGIVFSGDFFDLYSIAKQNKGLKIDLDLGQEYAIGREVMADFITAAKHTRQRSFLYGNHEDRFLRWMKDLENSKIGKALGAPEETLRLRENGFEVLTDWKDDSVLIGSHLEVIHGNFCGRNPCRTHLDNYDGSVMFGHTHGYGSIVTGKRASFNIGFLADRNAEGFKYVSRAIRGRWTNALAVVNELDSGDFLAQPIQAFNNRFVFDGRLY